MNTLLGKKIGMSRMFTEKGLSIPVTILDLSNNRVCQVKTADGSDGYNAVQIAYGSRKKKRLSNAVVGHLAKNKSGLAKTLQEVRCDDKIVKDLEVGSELGMEEFTTGLFVDVTGQSKGKGFAGVIRRHNFKSGRATHGNSRAHNKPGSTGQCQDPGKVFKGKKMPGHLGAKRSTVRNLKIAKVDEEKKLLFVAGGVPGAVNSEITVKISAQQKKSNGSGK